MWHSRAARLPSVTGGAIPPGALAAQARTRGAGPDVWQLATAPPAIVDRLARAELRQAAR